MSDVDYSDKTRFARGVAIIFAAQPDADVCATHDKVIYGDCGSTRSVDDEALEALGWRRSEGAWAFFT